MRAAVIRSPLGNDVTDISHCLYQLVRASVPRAGSRAGHACAAMAFKKEMVPGWSPCSAGASAPQCTLLLPGMYQAIECNRPGKKCFETGREPLVCPRYRYPLFP